jgi:predicted ester cyclase
VVFRKKDKEEEEANPEALLTDADQAELAQLPPGVRHVRRKAIIERRKRESSVSEYLHQIHEPGGLAARKAEADFMELGTPRAYLDALTGLELHVDDVAIAGDQAAVRWRVTGTHTGELCGVPPSGEQITLTGVSVIVMKFEFVMSDYTYWDFPELTRRVSAATPPAQGV